jgi:hypothetical protein
LGGLESFLPIFEDEKSPCWACTLVLDSNIGGVFLLNWKTYDPHNLAKKHNEAAAADGRSSGLGV